MAQKLKKPKRTTIKVYPEITDYLVEFGDPYTGPAVISRTMTATALGVSRSAIDGMLSRGTLSGRDINGVLCVNVQSLCERLGRQKGLVAGAQKFLEELAAKPHPAPVTYAPLMTLLGLSSTMSADRGRMGVALGTVSCASFEATKDRPEGGILLSALVHHKRTGRPSDAFFNLARELGFEFDDEDEFLAQQLAAIYAYYGRKSGR